MKVRLQSLNMLSREKVAFLVAVIFPLLILSNAIFRPWLLHPERALFLGLILILTILLTPLKSKGAVRGKIYALLDLILIMAGIACAIHIILDWDYIILHLGVPRPIDIALGITATLVTLEATRRRMFPLVPICLAFLLYALYGHHLSGIMGAPPVSLPRLVQQLYLQTTGLYGLALNAGLKYIFPFVIMGCLLKAMGAMDVLSDFVNILVGRTTGGPAKIAVLTSSMFGMMSGSATANVAFTGTFTIPLMKRYGYKPEFAGGVEACSSTGGQLTPPILGTAAFIMANYTGIPYLRIMLAAILPALLYYLVIFLRVHYKAKQEGLQKPSEDIVGRISSFREIIPRLIPLVIVLTILIVGLCNWTPTKAAVVTTAAIIPVSFLRRETWLTPRKILDGLRDATNSVMPIGAALIAIGILFGTATQTGLGLKFSEVMLIASRESLFLLLLVTSVACIFMGMGIAGPAVYVFAAIMLAPALIKLGVPLLPAHFFIFYWANIQSITPPVCIASYTAATIAGANPTKTALMAVSVGIMGFVLPFLFVFHTELLLEGSLVSSVISFLFMVIGLVALTFGFGGYLNRKLSLWERAVMLILAVIVFVQWNYVTSILGVAMIGVMILISILIKR